MKKLNLFLIILLGLSGCWILPKKVLRTIYFDVPDRSEDLVGLPDSESRQIESKEPVLQIEEGVGPYELNSRTYFTEGFLLSKSKPNTLSSQADGSMVAGFQDGSVHEFKLQGERKNLLVSRQIAKGTSPILAIKVSPDSKYLAVAQFSVVSILDLTELKLVAQLHRVKGRILDLAWSPDSMQLLMGRANGDVFSWSLEDNIRYTLDSLDVLEVYETEASPVVDVVFHPSGRAFFVALESGALFLVRLVKTEFDLGIREEGSGYEIEKGSFVQRFANVEGGISRLEIIPEREELLVTSFSGLVYRWRIRGLKLIENIDIGSEASTFSAFLGKEKSELSSDLILSVGRSLRLKLSCLSVDQSKLVEPTTAVFAEPVVSEPEESNPRGDTASLDDLDLIRELNAEIKTIKEEKSLVTKGGGKDFNLLMESAKYLESISIMELNSSADQLWLGGKSGTISAFYLKDFLKSSNNMQKIEAICK